MIRIEREYPHPRAKVWRALTDPALMALWSMRPEGFVPALGNRFRFVAKPQPGWRGFVDCEILEVREPSILSYSWVGDEGQKHFFLRVPEEVVATDVQLLPRPHLTRFQDEKSPG